jgi:uncharacterized OB-fold protein
MSAENAKPVPVSDPVTAPYFEGLCAGELRIQRCKACGQRQHYPRPFCMNCMSKDVQFEVDSGRGWLHAFTIVRAHHTKAFTADLPIVAALIELDGGVRLLSTLEGIAPDPNLIQIGMAVEVFFERVSDSVTLPRFRPVRGDDHGHH